MHSNATTSKVQITNISMANVQLDVAYAAYVSGELARIAVLELRAYDAGSGSRPSRTYTFSLPEMSGGSAVVRSLAAAGSDVLSGITCDGYSYEYALDEGKPILLSNVTRGEVVGIFGLVVSVNVEDVGAVILDFATGAVGGAMVIQSSKSTTGATTPRGSVATRSELGGVSAM